MIRRPPRSTPKPSSAASDVYKRQTITNVTVAAKNPGTWANGIKVAIIDGKADQILSTPDGSPTEIGIGVTQAISKTVGTATGTKTIDGYLKGVVCLLYTSPSPRDRTRSRMPSSA